MEATMLTRTRRDGDRYIVFARGADGEERIGFVRGSGRLWQAADTHMEQNRRLRDTRCRRGVAQANRARRRPTPQPRPMRTLDDGNQTDKTAGGRSRPAVAEF